MTIDKSVRVMIARAKETVSVARLAWEEVKTYVESSLYGQAPEVDPLANLSSEEINEGYDAGFAGMMKTDGEVQPYNPAAMEPNPATTEPFAEPAQSEWETAWVEQRETDRYTREGREFRFGHHPECKKIR